MRATIGEVDQDIFYRQTDALIRFYLHQDPDAMSEAAYVEAICQLEWLSQAKLIPISYTPDRS